MVLNLSNNTITITVQMTPQEVNTLKVLANNYWQTYDTLMEYSESTSRAGVASCISRIKKKTGLHFRNNKSYGYKLSNDCILRIDGGRPLRWDKKQYN